MADLQTIIEHWHRTGGVDIVVGDALFDALVGHGPHKLDKGEAQEVIIYQDHQLRALRGAIKELLSALDVLGLPDAEEWHHIRQQAEALKQIARGD